MTDTFSRRLREKLAGRFAYDAAFNFALVTAGLAAVVHIVWFEVTFFAFRRRLDAATMVIVDWDPSVFMMHIRIGIALLVSVVGLFARRMIGLLLSLLALLWVAFEYVGWFLWSMRIKANADIQTFPSAVAQISNLYGASLWNIVVLVLVVAALGWSATRLKGVRSRDGING